MSNVTLNFDNKTEKTRTEACKLTLKPRTENIVLVPTKSNGLGVIHKSEIMPGIYLAESLTEEINGYCVTSIINTLEKEITIETPCVQLEEINLSEETTLIFSGSKSEVNDRTAKLQHELRTSHLSDEE
jgi:hypothetical protein